MSEFKPTWFMVPSRIMSLPGLTLAYLRIYEAIFQLWNRNRQCFRGNASIMEMTGITSESTLREAFMFFEKHGELIRKTVNGKRYIIQPSAGIGQDSEPVDNPENGSTKISQGVATPTPPRRSSDAPPVAKSTHNNNKLNIKNLIKSVSDDQKQIKPVDKSSRPVSGHAPVDKCSNSYGVTCETPEESKRRYEENMIRLGMKKDINGIFRRCDNDDEIMDQPCIRPVIKRKKPDPVIYCSG